MKKLIILFAFWFLTVPCFATTITVDDDGPADFNNIPAAITAAANGDTIIVADGTYTCPVLQNINFQGKNITVRSTDPNNPNIVAATVIQGTGCWVSPVIFRNGETSQAVLAGFTITGGSAGTLNSSFGSGIFWGGAIYCYNASPTIVGNVIIANDCTGYEDDDIVQPGYGGAIACINSSAVITRNIIRDNFASVAGGIITVLGNPKITNNLIYENSAGMIGGAALLYGGQLINNTVVANSAAEVGNLYISSNSSGQPFISSNIICSALEGGGMYSETSGSIIKYNNVWNNIGGNYSGADSNVGNISADPLFIDSAAHNYHLQTGSPCINAGNPLYFPEPDQFDIDGQQRIIAGRVDIGADEYSGNFRPIADAGDDQTFKTLPLIITLNGSGSVDFDGDIITYKWTQIDGPAVQLNNPNAVSPSFEPKVPGGIYVFELVVNDGVIDSFPDTVSIAAGNVHSPVADAGDDQSFSSLPLLVTLDGSGSFDVDEDAISYNWTQIEGPEIELNDRNTISPSFEPNVPGIYVFELVVNDGLHDSLPDIVGIVAGNDRAPVAEAGFSRYAAYDPIVLDGSDSYDLDGYGILSFQWTQISGSPVNITDADTPTPTISGFPHKNVVQEYKFQLLVSDGALTSLPDTVSVITVPYFGATTLYQSNPPFDPEKPTIVAFGGGNCAIGEGMEFGGIWSEKANWITINTYGTGYDVYGDMLIVYLSSLAPDYKQPIQTMGFSTGNMPAIDVANRVNSTYKDPRYAINRVSLLDAACTIYTAKIATFLANPVGGEQCWIDNYIATKARYYTGVLNVRFPAPPADHSTPILWYIESAYPSTWPSGDLYNGGITAGYYYSVIGPGKNLQLAANTNPYYFKWIDGNPDYLVFNDQSSSPGKLPQAVTLVGPADGAVVDSNGALLSCEESENAVGYQLLFGPDPYHMNYLVSDTPAPPNEVITLFPYDKTWWTVKVRDHWGSTIYADPICLNAGNVPHRVKNLNTGEEFYFIHDAIEKAADGDELVAVEDTYRENINFGNKNLILRSTNPCDTTVVAATIIDGRNFGSAVTISGGQNTNCLLAGFSIINGSSDYGGGIYCYKTSPTLKKCIIAGNSAIFGGGICGYRSSPIITGCIITDNSATTSGGGITLSDGQVINCSIIGNSAVQDGGGLYRCRGPITNCIIWDNVAANGSQLNSSSEPAYSCIRDCNGVGPGNINADPCLVDVNNDNCHLCHTSPCINTGDPNFIPEPDETDLDCLPRIIGGRIDMGAYEFNHQPIAVADPNQTAYAWINGFADVNLDGSASFDYDNDILDYYWSWTINDSNYEANGVNPAITLPVGNHTIELIVDDGIDLSEPDYCTINVIKAVRGKLLLNPQVIQTKISLGTPNGGSGKWIIATLFILPAPGEQINKEQPLRLYPSGIEAKYQRFYKYGMFQRGPTFAIAFFDKQQVIDALGLGTTKISIVGEFLSDRFFFGSDNIKIISPKPKPPNPWHW